LQIYRARKQISGTCANCFLPIWRPLTDLRVMLQPEAVQLLAQKAAFHPVRDYLDALKWDGTERLAHGSINMLAPKRRTTRRRSVKCFL
jgi:predicted P-loop ATPase